MRRMNLRQFIYFACVLLWPSFIVAQGIDALATYKSGDYKTAIPLLQAAAAKSPRDPVMAAALLSALVYEGRVDEAADAANAAAGAFPNSPEVTAARGELAYYMSDMAEAERLFRAAMRLKEGTPRAYYGMYRIFRAASLHKSARLLCFRAHELDPDDALITLAFLRYLTAEKRAELEGPFRAAHPWFYPHYQRDEETRSDVKGELNGRKIFELQGARQETTIPLHYLGDPQHAIGVGVQLSIQGARPLRLLLDTGSSGILINQGAVDKAGLNHLGSGQVSGIGDKGARGAFAAVAESCRIGTLEYKTCIFGAVQGKGRVAGAEEDGLIGADFFSDYLIQIDFQRRLMHLTPLADREPNPQGYDRVIPPEEKSFTPVLRYGSHLYIQTKVNNKTWGLFLLDTGSSSSSLDSSFARLSTKIHGDYYTTVKGVSGSVKDVFEADKAELQFGHFRQSNLGLTAIDLNNSPEHQDFRMAGILGVPVLAMFRLTLDYRNGLVNFDYVLK
jgi:predicted aspartyl protease